MIFYNLCRRIKIKTPPYHSVAWVELDVNYLQEAEDYTAADNGRVHYQFGDVWRGGKFLKFQHVFYSQNIVEHYLLKYGKICYMFYFQILQTFSILFCKKKLKIFYSCRFV